MEAIEAAGQTVRAAKDWERMFREGAVEIGRRNGPVLWHDDLKVWATFVPPKSRHWRPGAHLNYFGYRPYGFKHNTTVEISPPTKGQNTNLQGVFAVDENGDRWVLHQGRLHPGAIRIRQDMFAAVAPSELRSDVVFSDGRTIPYFRVANLDATARELQKQVADFVHLCDRVRTRYINGEAAAELQRKVEELEFRLMPERTGGFDFGARDGGRGKNLHGEVLEVLVRELQPYGLKLGNGRVGRHGPDLHTDGKPPKLFEVKSSRSSACIQQAVGQLHIYEQALQRKHDKIAVLPGPVHADWLKIMRTLDITVLEFRIVSGRPTFEPSALAKITGKSKV